MLCLLLMPQGYSWSLPASQARRPSQALHPLQGHPLDPAFPPLLEDLVAQGCPKITKMLEKEIPDSISWSRKLNFHLPVSLCSLHCPVLLAFLFDPASKKKKDI